MSAFTLPERVDISCCEVLLEELRTYYAQHEQLEIDAAAVTYITTPAIQILASFFATARKDTKPCSLHNASTALRDACGLLGLTDELKQWELANV